MATYIALLRGVNVGGNSKVAMKQLKALFESLGFKNVTTYINSGNVIFNSTKIVAAAILEKAIKKEFNLPIRVVVRDAQNILRLAQSIPKDWHNNPEQKTDVLFLWEQFDEKASLKLLESKKGIDNLKYFAGAIVWNIKRGDYYKSGMHKFIGTELYKHMTARNVNMVRTLAKLLQNHPN